MSEPFIAWRDGKREGDITPAEIPSWVVGGDPQTIAKLVEDYWNSSSNFLDQLKANSMGVQNALGVNVQSFTTLDAVHARLQREWNAAPALGTPEGNAARFVLADYLSYVAAKAGEAYKKPPSTIIAVREIGKKLAETGGKAITGTLGAFFEAIPTSVYILVGVAVVAGAVVAVVVVTRK